MALYLPLKSRRPLTILPKSKVHLAHVVTGNFEPPLATDRTPREIPPPTPVSFPECTPRAQDASSAVRGSLPLVPLLQSIYRPPDIQLAHFEALRLHVIPNASSTDLIPDASFLPPVHDWNDLSPEDLVVLNEGTRKPLNNGNLSPGVQTFRERQKELLIDNTAAFRTIRRIPPGPGESSIRLGNAYEFYKNLEFFSGYWLDTSLPPEAKASDNVDTDHTSGSESNKDELPFHLRTHVRTGTGSQIPPDYRQNLLSAFIKLVAYDFGCNVSFPRCEPRLHLTPPPANTEVPPSYFNSSVTFIYRTPTDRASARSGVVEGPVAVVSSRGSTGFTTKAESELDLAREVVAVLLTAQQRAREGKLEKRFGEGKWWTTSPRWGGGPGGPIGREIDRAAADEILGVGDKVVAPTEANKENKTVSGASVEAAKRAIGGISGPSPNKRSKKGPGAGGGNMQIYDNYRRMNPPSSTWDRKARYSAIGKEPGRDGDDIFLLSCLNHHISIIRVRVPEKLLEVLDGADVESWGIVTMWRSKWYDLYLKEERVDAMGLVWGMMSFLMRKIDSPAPRPGDEVATPTPAAAGTTEERMDLS